MANPAQDDTDGDNCGNICDGDFNQDGDIKVGELFVIIDFLGLFDELHNMSEPVTDDVKVGDIFVVIPFLGFPAGPSATTEGTLACPLPAEPM